MTKKKKNRFKIHRFLINIRHHRKSEGSYLAVIYLKKKNIYHASIPGVDTLLFGLFGYAPLFRVYSFLISHLEKVSFEAGIL